MTEAVRIGNATLYCGDCLEILPTLDKVDAVITDPPYGIGMDGGKCGNANYKKLDWDSQPANISNFVKKDIPTIIWGGNYFGLPAAGKWLVWDKKNDQTTFADCELAWTNLHGAIRQFRWLWSGPYQQLREERFHPTQKPVALMRWCIEQAGNPKIILDPYMGSGTTGVAALQMGKHFIGIEKEPCYFDIACERIENAQRQGRLFETPPSPPPTQAGLNLEAAP